MAAGKPPRGRITRHQELCLQTNSLFLKTEMECEHIVDHLHRDLILDKRDVEHILGPSLNRLPQYEANSLLLDTLLMRTSRGFDAFLQALEDTGHLYAARKLRETVEKLEVSENERTSASTRAERPRREEGRHFEEKSTSVSTQEGKLPREEDGGLEEERTFRSCQPERRRGRCEGDSDSQRVKAELEEIRQRLIRCETQMSSRSQAESDSQTLLTAISLDAKNIEQIIQSRQSSSSRTSVSGNYVTVQEHSQESSNTVRPQQEKEVLQALLHEVLEKICELGTRLQGTAPDKDHVNTSVRKQTKNK